VNEKISLLRFRYHLVIITFGSFRLGAFLLSNAGSLENLTKISLLLSFGKGLFLPVVLSFGVQSTLEPSPFDQKRLVWGMGTGVNRASEESRASAAGFKVFKVAGLGWLGKAGGAVLGGS
jgi:hypothetical protein